MVNKITNIVDSIEKIFAQVLTHFFDPPLSKSNLLSDIFAACIN